MNRIFVSLFVLSVLPAVAQIQVQPTIQTGADRSIPIPAGATYPPGPIKGGGIANPLLITIPGTQSGTLRITIQDGWLVGDVYEAILDGKSLGWTQPVPVGGPNYSSGTFTAPVTPGVHQVDIFNITLSYIDVLSPFGGGIVGGDFSPSGVLLSATFETDPDLVPSSLQITRVGSAARLSAKVTNEGSASTTARGKNIAKNSSFEDGTPNPQATCAAVNAATSISDWTLAGTNLYYCGTFWQPGDIQRSLLLNGVGGSISQQIQTTPGLTYAVRLLLTGNPYGATANNSIRISAAGSSQVLTQSNLGTSTTDMGWKIHTWSFIANAQTTTIKIEQVSGLPLIDAVEAFEISPGIPVTFYQGDPATGGTKLGTVLTSTALDAGQQGTVEYLWANPPVGPNSIVVVVDDDGTGNGVVTEADESNNKIGAILTIDPTSDRLVDSVISRFKDSSADVIWARVDGAVSYNVYRRGQARDLQRIRSGITATSITDSGLTNGQTYFYTVRWLNAQGVESSDGTEASSTPTPTGSTGKTPPTILSYPTVRGTAGLPYSYALRAGDPDRGDVLSYSLISPPAGMTISPSGLIQWTPATGNAGYNRVAVRVEDSTGRFATQTYQLFVDVVFTNHPPAFSSTPITSARTGVQYAYQATAVDPDTGDLLQFSLPTAPAGMTINGSGLITWTPLITHVGTRQVTVRVSDLAGAAVTQSFEIEVERYNRPPQIISFAPTTGRAGQIFAYQVRVNDPDQSSGDTFTFDFTAAPDRMAVDPISGLVQWTPTTTQQGNQQATVRVTDSGGLTASQTFTVNVLPPNQSPVITSTPITKAAINGQYVYSATSTDPDGDERVWSVTTGPMGLTINPATGQVFWIPATEQLGDHSVTIRVADSFGASVTQSYTITVGPEDKTNPTVTILTPVSGASLNNDVAVTGTVTDDNLQEWTVSYRVPGDTTWIKFGSGTANVNSGPLGTFRASLLANNPYRILLMGRDIAGNSNSQEIEVRVNTGEMKLGDFSLTFTDMQIPGLNLPVAIQRTYDTKQPQDGGFGPHWALSFTGIYLKRDVNYNVFVTLPSGRRVEFNYTPQPIGLGVFNTRWTAENGVYDTIENTDCPQVLGAPPSPLCNGFQLWDPQNWILRTKEGITYFISSGGGVRRMEDRNGNWIEISPTGVTTNTGQNISFVRDTSGRIAEIHEPTPSTGVIRYEYDDDGRLARFIDGAGAITRYFYENGSFPYYLTRIDDPLGRPALRNIFDESGHLVAQCDANGNPTTLAGCARFNPDSNARTQTIYNSRGFRTDLIVDERGNVVTERRYLGATNYLETIRTYDSNNNLLTEQDPEGNVKSYTYDLRGNRLTETDPGGRTTTYTYVPSCDKVERIIDPAGNVTTNSYDEKCNLRFVKDALSNSTEYRYNGTGQRTQMIDPNGTTWTWNHLSNGLLESMVDPFGKATLFSFDSKGNLLSRTDRNNRRIDFEYDPANRLKKETWDNGRVTDYTYDDAGSLLTAIDPDSSLTMTYDNLGRLKTINNGGTPGASQVLMTYVYDANSNVTGVLDSLGGTTEYSYDGLDRLSRVTQSGSGVQPKRVDLSYTNASLLKDLKRFSDLSGTQGVANTNYEYDCGGCLDRLLAIRHRKTSDNSVIHDLTFASDRLGNITTMTDAEGSHTYLYDKIRRLTSAIHPGGGVQPNEFYTYDAVGNRLTSHLSASYSYSWQTEGSGNRLLQDSKCVYTYDFEGNLIKRTALATGAYTEYAYDFRNRIVQIVEHTATGVETAKIEYLYDAIDRRIRVFENGRVFWFVYDENNPVLRIGAQDGVFSHRLFAGGIDSILADETEAETNWFLTDQLGTVRDIRSNQAIQINHYVFDSFGSVMSQGSSLGNNDLLFTGREFNGDGSGYFRSRLYSSSTGRFYSEDLVSPFGYNYPSDNPLSFTDPFGLSGDDSFLLSISQRARPALECLGREIAKEVAIQGVYIALFESGLYVGQSGNIARRLSQHKRLKGALKAFVTIALPGNGPGFKLIREQVEQAIIDQLGFDALSNKVNPLGGRPGEALCR